MYINSDTSKLGDLEVRQVWAFTAAFGDRVDEHVACELLRANSKVKVGAWKLAQNRGGFVAVFAAQISAETDARSLATIVRAVGMTADEKEKELTGKDNL